MCQIKRPHASPQGPWSWLSLPKATVGRFVAIPSAMSLTDAKAACEADGYQGLASIHSRQDQIDASRACRQIASVDSEWQHGVPESCWIGLTDDATLAPGRANENTFVWTDGTPVNYLNWNVDEPNECQGCGGEDGVAIDYRWQRGDSYEFGGGWNDANEFGRAGGVIPDGYVPAPPAAGQPYVVNHGAGQSRDAAFMKRCWGCDGTVGYFPLCQTEVPSVPPPPPPPPGSPVVPNTYSRSEPVAACVAQQATNTAVQNPYVAGAQTCSYGTPPPPPAPDTCQSVRGGA
eukprot:SAG11_NODE_3256_length_2576_cov_1.271296_3_plen_288_part_01